MMMACLRLETSPDQWGTGVVLASHVNSSPIIRVDPTGTAGHARAIWRRGRGTARAWL